MQDLELGEAVDVPVGVYHLDAVHGHHGDLSGDCQPVLEDEILTDDLK